MEAESEVEKDLVVVQDEIEDSEDSDYSLMGSANRDKCVGGGGNTRQVAVPHLQNITLRTAGMDGRAPR